MEWFEGYSDETQQGFQDDAQQQWGDVTALNTRWQTSFASLNEVVPPEYDSSDRFWSDWMSFRADSINQLLYDYVAKVREYDSVRPIFVYNDVMGVDLAHLETQGCFTANGGVHSATKPQDYVALPLMGIQDRAEDHWPGKWQGYNPTMLDGSLFGMTLGGGASTHTKAYMFTFLPGVNVAGEELPFSYFRQEPYGLQRYEQFMSIASELRQCTPPTYETFMFRDLNSFLTETGILSLNGYFDGWASLQGYQSHLPIATGPHSLWQNAKLLMVTKPNIEILEEDTIDQLVAYVQNGGTLLMRANAGRTEIDNPDDWVLLKAFGFAAPTADPRLEPDEIGLPCDRKYFPCGSR
jgi:hypothetical protein